MTDKTIDYYNQNAAAFAADTVSAGFSTMQKKFADRLPEGARILDFGCGSGRDSRAFLSMGFTVDAADGSEELCRIASEYAGIPVKHMYFQDLDEEESYDGIWACSSILHLPAEQLPDVLAKIERALKPSGVLYTSFKYGDFAGERNGRYFTDLTEETFEALLKNTGLKIEEMWVTGDVRPGRSGEKWLNILAVRT